MVIYGLFLGPETGIRTLWKGEKKRGGGAHWGHEREGVSKKEKIEKERRGGKLPRSHRRVILTGKVGGDHYRPATRKKRKRRMGGSDPEKKRKVLLAAGKLRVMV